MGRALIMAGLDSISFSFDVYNKEDYEKKRSGADFYITLDNIRQFLKIKKQLGKKNPLTVIQLMSATGEDNKVLLEQKKGVLEDFKECPPDRIVIRRPHNWGGLLETAGDKTGPEARKHACTFPWYSLTIFSDGKAVPCPQDFVGAMPVGDLNKDPLTEILNSQPLRELRKMFRSGVINEKLPCFKCDRIIRNTFMGIPLEYAGVFLRDSL